MTSPQGLQIRDVAFAYDDQVVLSGFDLDVRPGSLFALLGPSGSGKSTLLGLLAGLLTPQRGTIQIGDEDVTRLPARQRRVGVVFQSYALFPHLSARDNIAFAPERASRPADEVDHLVRDLAERLGIASLLERRPDELSGGQQQRVALARALAMQPRLLLLDEPMSNVDPALRTHLRGELRAWLNRWQITTVLVTHDREDAFWLADELGLLLNGRLHQRGTPREVYERPADLTAARLLGPAEPVPVAVDAETLRWRADRSTHTALVRPEHVRFVPGPGEPDTSVDSVVTLGNETRVRCQVAGAWLWATTDIEPEVGMRGHLVTLQTPPLVDS